MPVALLLKNMNEVGIARQICGTLLHWLCTKPQSMCVLFSFCFGRDKSEKKSVILEGEKDFEAK
jgi:hypothetical protein